jgi:isopenicillin-N epimerase
VTEFAAQWGLEPNVIYLNHGAFGACPLIVLEEQREFRARLERQPVRFFMRELEGLLDETRRVLGAFLGADPQDLAFVSNATAGVNTVLASLPLRTGAEVLITNHTYAACRNAVEYWAARASASVRVVEVPFPIESATEVTSAVLAGLSARTQFAVLDHITSPTGLIFPIRDLVRELAARGVETLVDGAHAPGMVPLDLTELGAAYYTGNLHKWCCAPKGAAFIWARRDLQAALRPLVVSHGAASSRRDRSRFQLEFDWVGTTDPTAFLSVPKALRFLDTLAGGIAALRARNRELVLAGRTLLCGALATKPPCPAAMIGSIAAITFPEETPKSPSPDELYGALIDRHQIEVPIVPWPGARSGFVRISAQAYNTLEHYERLRQALCAELGLDAR